MLTKYSTGWQDKETIISISVVHFINLLIKKSLASKPIQLFSLLLLCVPANTKVSSTKHDQALILCLIKPYFFELSTILLKPKKQQKLLVRYFWVRIYGTHIRHENFCQELCLIRPSLCQKAKSGAKTFFCNTKLFLTLFDQSLLLWRRRKRQEVPLIDP
jgi:hypothetical protein